MTLADVLAAAADEAGITAAPSGEPDNGTTWAAGGRPFTTLDETGAIASFRLDAELAAAARRTPDTAASPLGPAWVVFSPREIDEHAADRATAWFAAAERRARG